MGLDDRRLVATIDAALDVLTGDRLRLPGDAERLELLAAGLRAVGRLQAWVELLAAGVEADKVAWREYRTSTTTWLVESVRLAPREAARLVRAGEGLSRFPQVGAAALGGQVSAGQAEAITQVLAQLPDDLPAGAVEAGQEHLVGLAASHNAVELRRLSRHLLDVVAPETAEELEAKRLERELRAARAARFLEFHNDGCGSVLLRGSLPVVDAEPLIRIVDAYAAAEKRGLDAADPAAEYLTPGMRRADALMAMVHHHTQQALAPTNGGDRPRIVVALSYDTLVKQCRDARLVGRDEPITASVARRLLCDADILPVVLGGPSQVLDVGRCARLVTPAIRAALEHRDGGCVFPGCTKPPEACHAHHLKPWWAGGPTALSNLALVCAHHHGIVEPSHTPEPEDRWHIRLRADGAPEVVPPRRVDPTQRPRQHTRFLTRQRR